MKERLNFMRQEKLKYRKGKKKMKLLDQIIICLRGYHFKKVKRYWIVTYFMKMKKVSVLENHTIDSHSICPLDQ